MKEINISVPGSLMLFGEHAVLHGGPAIVTAINHRMRLCFRERPDHCISVRSALGRLDLELDQLHEAPMNADFRFIQVCLQQHPPPGGLDIHIDSDFPPTVGFGSSAAVVAGTLAGLSRLQGLRWTRENLHTESLAVVRVVQGRGSGADLAASIFGGLVAYRPNPPSFEPLPAPPPISVVYVGYKTSTPEVIERVRKAFDDSPDRKATILNSIDRITETALAECRNRNWDMVGHAMSEAQRQMHALGVSDSNLHHLVESLRLNGCHGAKISGAGLGDCVIGIGRAGIELPGYQSIPAATDPQGLEVVE